MTTASATRRLVIVADNSLIVEAIRVGFRRSGEFNLVGHVNAEIAGARAVLEVQPDVVLLDDMNGHEHAVELIREISQADVSVMVLSARMDAERVERLLDAGASAVISKASHPAALATLVRETLNGHIVHRLRGSDTQAGAAPSAAAMHDSPLTRREQQILQLVAGGCTNGEIARRLWVTEQTVKFHLRNIYRKLGVANRTEASHVAHVNGFIDLQAGVSVTAAPEVSAVAS